MIFSGSVEDCGSGDACGRLVIVVGGGGYCGSANLRLMVIIDVC